MKASSPHGLNDLFVGAHTSGNITFRGNRNHEMALDGLASSQHFVAMTKKSKATMVGARIKQAREARSMSQAALSKLINQSQSAISFWEKGEREPGRDIVAKIALALGVSAEDLELPVTSGSNKGAETDYVRVVGRAGADPEGRIIRTHGQYSGDMAPMPTGGTSNSVAVEIDGHSMRGYAENGALVYYEERRMPPTEDMIGEVVVVQVASEGDESDDEDVLIKELQRGSADGLYNLVSIVGPTMKDVRVRWAAEIIQIIPPRQARRLIKRGIA